MLTQQHNKCADKEKISPAAGIKLLGYAPTFILPGHVSRKNVHMTPRILLCRQKTMREVPLSSAYDLFGSHGLTWVVRIEGLKGG